MHSYSEGKLGSRATSSENPHGNPVDDGRFALNIAAFIIRTWAISLEVFLRTGTGLRYPGPPGVAVFVLIPMYGCGWPGHDLWPLFLMLPAYLAMCIRLRISNLWQRMHNRPMVHSWYNGFPCLCRLMPFLSEGTAKRLVEPFLVFVTGAACAIWNAPFGCYLIGASVCLLISHSLGEEIQRQQALDMHDAMIQQRQVADRFRQLRNRGRW
ncbi:MAG: hypothetical protein SFV23_16820 [Planctomycetaceae bacterium]|nr:hypothetical protein [Planctomycetaceae bacterium]